MTTWVNSIFTVTAGVAIFALTSLDQTRKVNSETEDILVIIRMKVLGMRLRDVCMHEANGSILKQTAQLVYVVESTSRTDLVHPNVDVLSLVVRRKQMSE